MIPMMTRHASKLGEQIRKAIGASKLSRYAICKRAGIDQSAMSRFVVGKSELTVDGIERVADALGLEVVIQPKRKRAAK
jgi:transcriptional regulator with XRE-family HTH domain